jgi:hypothetical protein
MDNDEPARVALDKFRVTDFESALPAETGSAGSRISPHATHGAAAGEAYRRRRHTAEGHAHVHFMAIRRC